MRSKTFYIILSLLLLSGNAWAQSVPAGEDVGAQGQRFQAESERQRKELESKEKKAAPMEMGEQSQQPPAGDLKFVLKAVNITGSTLFNPGEFLFLYQPLIGKEVTLADIQAVADAIRSKYKSRSYLTTTVVIPEQEIKDGVVEVRVLEGRMGKLKVEGNKYFPLSQISKSFHIKENDLLNLNRMLRDVLRLNQNSDFQGKTVIAAGKDLGTSDVTLKVKDKFPWHVGASEDNTGTRLTGKYRTGFTVRGTNATGHMDSLFLSTSFTHLSFGQFASYRLPVGETTKIGVDATYFRMRIGREFNTQEIRGVSQIYTPQIVQELWLDDRSQGSATLGMEVKSIKKTAMRVKTTNDQLRVPFLALDISREDAFGQTSFMPRLNVSMENFAGASHRGHLSASRQGTGGKFVKYDQGLSRIQRMPWGSYATVRTNFQAASCSLPSSEQMQLGGMNSVRGYPEGDYMADVGGFVNLDWFLPVLPQPWRHQIMPVVFMDYGAGSLKKVNPGESHEKSLMGVGGGLRLRLGRSMVARLEWARDVKDRPISGSGPSVFYFQCQAEF